MEMSNKIFQTCRVDPVALEEYLNDLAEEGGWVLHSIHPTQMGGSIDEQLFTVIVYAPYDWEAAERNAQARKYRLDKQTKEAMEKWAAAAGSTGGHANE